MSYEAGPVLKRMPQPLKFRGGLVTTHLRGETWIGKASVAKRAETIKKKLSPTLSDQGTPGVVVESTQTT